MATIKKATAKDFLDGKTTRASARKMAKAVNAVVKALLPLSPKKREAVLVLASPD